MINNYLTFFTGTFESTYEPIHLLLGISIGIIAVLVLIKKIIARRNKK